MAVFAIVAIMATMPALGAESDYTAVERRISDLKTFINDGNVVLFHNELMEFQGEAFSAGSARKVYAQFIFDVWEQDTASHSDLNWQNAGKDEFRVSIAAVITLGIRDGWIDFNQEEINRYFRARLTVDNPHVSLMSTLHLAVGGNDEDAMLFKELSLSETEHLARRAIKALGMMCRPAGEESLKQLASELPDSKRRALVIETLERYYGDGPALRCI
jgi:hypothetical protein